MKKFMILIILLLLLPVHASIIKYREKVWYEKPVFPLNAETNLPFLIFKTPIYEGKNSTTRVFFVNEKIILLKDFNVEIYDTSFKFLKRIYNLKQKIGYDEKWGKYGLVIPSPTGDKLVLGYANRREKKYYIYILDLNSKGTKLLKVLDKLHFPGIAPIKRAKEIIKQDPDFADNYFSLVYENEDFAGGYWIGNNLYFWFYPKYGFHFGGLYSLDLNSGKLTSFHPKFDKLIGINNKGEIAYTLLKDEDAAEVYKAIYIKTKRRTFTVPGVELSAGAAFNGLTLVYETQDKKIAVFNIEKKTTVASFPLPGKDLKILYVTPSGNRFFFSATVKKYHRNFYVFDVRDGRYYPLFSTTTEPVVSNISTCYDGEFIVFRNRNDIWAGYLPDIIPPRLEVKVYPPLVGGKIYKEEVKLKVFARDACFVSGIEEPSIEFKGIKHKSGEVIKVRLNQGKNVLNLIVKDRAGNVRTEKKNIVFEKPVKTTLKEIGENPGKYAGKVLLLEGYAWGWMTKHRPKEIERLSKLPLAKGNTAKSRNDGSFSDGTALVFFPIAPTVVGRYRIYAIIQIRGNKWIIKPLFKETIK